MQKITVKLKKVIDDSYTMMVGENLTPSIQQFVKTNYPSSKICIIADEFTSKLFGKKLLLELKTVSDQIHLITFPSGEKNKNLKNVEKICQKMVKNNFNRKDLIIALGGGVTGDLAGFVASIYMRGIAFIQIPTSLLAMVDSSSGGKTGVDLSSGKNLLGSFYQPKAVFIDIKYLNSLPEKEFNNGMAEIIKHGIIIDEKYFAWIEEEKIKIQNRDSKILIKLIYKSCIIKKSVVEKDENESGLRMILNYGHTIGHALEQLSKYKLGHGEAISIGMCKENNLNKDLRKLDKRRIQNLLEFFKLPTSHKLCQKSKELIDLIKKDKKIIHQLPRFAIPVKIGKTKIEEFTSQEISKALND